VVRVIAGVSHGTAGAVQREATQPLYLDIIFPEGGGSFSQPLPAAHNAFILRVPRLRWSVAGTQRWHASAWPSWPTKATASPCRPAAPPGPC
jgi:redox-sensitive bicupin YhaK (pirin superfamily)